jgi:hypothetical protein
MPFSMSDSEFDCITAFSKPLPPFERSRFVSAVADEVERLPPGGRGEGSVHQIASRLQIDFLRGKALRSQKQWLANSLSRGLIIRWRKATTGKHGGDPYEQE